MKKTFSFLFVLSMLISVFAVGASALAYTFGELSFEIPDNFSFYEENDTSWTGFSPDEKVKFKAAQISNEDSVSYQFSSLPEVIDFYISELCSFDEGYNFDSIQVLDMLNSNDCYCIFGTPSAKDDHELLRSYLFVTETYFYVFEFSVADKESLWLVDEIADSFYILDNDVNASDFTVYSDYEADDEMIWLFPLLIIAVVIGAMKKYGMNIIAFIQLFKSENSEVSKEKTELNGKIISKFSFKRSDSGSGENFASDELEKERKEREKMFK